MPMIPCFNCNPNDEGTADPACPYCSGKGQIQTDAETAQAVNEAIIRRRATQKPERYPVAIAAYGDHLAALANDGTLWRTSHEGWRSLEALPQPKADL